MTKPWSNSHHSQYRFAPFRRGFNRLVLIALAAGIVLSGFQPVGSGAAPTDDKKAQAKALQTQIEDLDLKISAAAEQMNVAEEARDTANQAAVQAQAQITAARAEVARIRQLVRERLASIYRQSTSSQGVSEFDLSNAKQLLRSRQYAKTQSSKDDGMLNQLAIAQQDLTVKKADYNRVAAAAEAQAATIANSKKDFEAAQAQQAGVLAQVTTELDALIKTEQRRLAAAAAAQRGGGGRSGPPESFPALPPPGPAAENAIAWGRTQLGKAYGRTNRFGPDNYDCSGFTYMAYGMAGVSIPKVSGPQYMGLPHVSMDALQIGDLIFWGTNGSDHVAIYTGGGNIIESRSGGVQEGPIWGSPSVAARPGV